MAEKEMFTVQSANPTFTGTRNRGKMSLTFKEGKAQATKAQAEYWAKQPGYSCPDLAAKPAADPNKDKK
jgi:hypothetical protein